MRPDYNRPSALQGRPPGKKSHIYIYMGFFFRRSTLKGTRPVVVWPHCIDLSYRQI